MLLCMLVMLSRGTCVSAANKQCTCKKLSGKCDRCGCHWKIKRDVPEKRKRERKERKEGEGGMLFKEWMNEHLGK